MVVLTTFTQPTEGIRQRQPNTTAYVNDNNLGKGTLYVAESCLSWISDSGNGFSIEYPNISLHAVSRDLSAFPYECLFLMLDIALGDEETKNGEEDGDGGASYDEETTTELRFVPDDKGMLDAMFHAMNVCQALHPDPEDSVSDEDIYEDADNDIQMEETDSRMANLQIGRPLTFLGNNHMECQSSGILPQGLIGERQQQWQRETQWQREKEQVQQREVLQGSLGNTEQYYHRVPDIEEDIEEVVGTAEDIEVVGTAEDIEVVGTAEDMEEGEGVDNNGRMVGHCNFGNPGHFVQSALSGSNASSAHAAHNFAPEVARRGRDQGDRSSHLGNNLHQGSSGVLPGVHSPHTASHFSDAES